ncbi:hypothetical protein DFH08DRAFT_803358 [Mycena albidolilacea]|uniref:Uncharacterized protein n=1 Tax=Mycena albidolilacea TaxID=1033008 RepID=A0AAD7ADP7_9AGAR|nr:hypothetical protein DFH08DRAFT_803358 [Mycena albidolilacea]
MKGLKASDFLSVVFRGLIFSFYFPNSYSAFSTLNLKSHASPQQVGFDRTNEGWRSSPHRGRAEFPSPSLGLVASGPGHYRAAHFAQKFFVGTLPLSCTLLRPIFKSRAAARITIAGKLHSALPLLSPSHDSRPASIRGDLGGRDAVPADPGPGDDRIRNTISDLAPTTSLPPQGAPHCHQQTRTPLPRLAGTTLQRIYINNAASASLPPSISPRLPTALRNPASVFPLMGTRQFMTILEKHDFGDAPRVVAMGTSYVFFKLEERAELGRGNVRCQFVRASLSCHEDQGGAGIVPWPVQRYCYEYFT